MNVDSQTIKIAEATSLQLNWLVAKLCGMHVTNQDGGVFWPGFSTMTACTNWAQAGPLIESSRIEVSPTSWIPAVWIASEFDRFGEEVSSEGPTPLIAAMRCFVRSKLGKEAEIPEELIKERHEKASS